MLVLVAACSMSPWSQEPLPDGDFNVQRVLFLDAERTLVGGNASRNIPTDPVVYLRTGPGAYREVWRSEGGRNVVDLKAYGDVVWLLASFAPDPAGRFSDHKLFRSVDQGETWTLRSLLPRSSAKRLVVGPKGDLWVHGTKTLLHADSLGISWDDVQKPGVRSAFKETLLVTEDGALLSSESDPLGVQLAWQEGALRAGRRQKTPVFSDGNTWTEMAPGTVGKVLDVHVDGDEIWALVSRRVGKLASTVDLVVSRDRGAHWEYDSSVVASTLDRPYDVGDGGRVISGDLVRTGMVWVRAPNP